MHAEIYAQAVISGIIPTAHNLRMDNTARIRELRGLTQGQLAEMVQANQATISKIESGKGNPTLSMINRIAKALDVHPSQLFALDTLKQRAVLAIEEIGDPAQKEAAVIVLESMAHRTRG